MSSNPILIHFLLTTVFSFVAGLEVRAYKEHVHPDSEINFFGSARTFTFIGIIGFVSYRLEPIYMSLYITILLIISMLYAIFYIHKLNNIGKQSILIFLVMLCVYSFGPLLDKFPLWVPSLLFVLIVFILDSKSAIQKLTVDINMYEFVTLSKMVLLSAVILPLLPNSNIIPYIPLSPFKIWLAVVVISAISYGGYIAQKYFFPSKGYYLTGLIGGTYSSTATTVVLSRKQKSVGYDPIIEAGIISATSVMYIRLIVIAAIFNIAVAKALLIPFVTLSLIGFVISFIFLKSTKESKKSIGFVDQNPLELGTAFIFAALFVIMMVITQFVTQEYGSSGLEILSLVVGFTDIDPFVLSLITGKYSVTITEVATAIMIASGSNNFLKAIYAIWFGGVRSSWKASLIISLLGVATIAWAVFYGHLIKV